MNNFQGKEISIRYISQETTTNPIKTQKVRRTMRPIWYFYTTSWKQIKTNILYAKSLVWPHTYIHIQSQIFEGLILICCTWILAVIIFKGEYNFNTQNRLNLTAQLQKPVTHFIIHFWFPLQLYSLNVLHVCLSSDVTFDHKSFCEILYLWRFKKKCKVCCVKALTCFCVFRVF